MNSSVMRELTKIFITPSDSLFGDGSLPWPHLRQRFTSFVA